MYAWMFPQCCIINQTHFLYKLIILVSVSLLCNSVYPHYLTALRFKTLMMRHSSRLEEYCYKTIKQCFYWFFCHFQFVVMRNSNHWKQSQHMSLTEKKAVMYYAEDLRTKVQMLPKPIYWVIFIFISVNFKVQQLEKSYFNLLPLN